MNISDFFKFSRCDAVRDPVLARCHAIRGDVRPDGAGAGLHDRCLRRRVQG